MAFHLGCLRALNDLDLLEKIGVLSTISGGSVIGAYYAYTPGKSFEEFDAEICEFLRVGFQRKIAAAMLHPENLIPGFVSWVLSHTQDGIGLITGKPPRFPRYRSRTDVFENVLQRGLFPALNVTSPTRSNLVVVIGACELRTGTAFRFGNERSGGHRHGALIDKDVPLSFAVAASAAYPVFLPAFDREFEFDRKGTRHTARVSLTDGGVYDNLGIQVLEPGRDPRYSLHSYACDYIIACNAGQGQEAGIGIPLGFGSRVKRSFEVVHRRVQDNAMHHLHALKHAGRLRGFAMPYLGQQDSSLPWPPVELEPRESVINYPTDFAAMPEVAMKALSSRGEQLTRALVSAYLPQLVG